MRKEITIEVRGKGRKSEFGTFKPDRSGCSTDARKPTPLARRTVAEVETSAHPVARTRPVVPLSAVEIERQRKVFLDNRFGGL